MSDRLPSAASHAAYYEQQQHSTITSALNKATMPLQAALQQRLQDYHQPNTAYESRYYPSGPTYATHPHAFPYGSLHYPSGAAYLNHHHHHSHYDSMYNGRLIGGSGGGGSAGLMYGDRSRYLPYPQQPNLRGMFTAAGQQLVPSRVLHYPPSSCGSAYQQQQHSQQSQYQQNHHTNMYDHRNEPHSQYQLQHQHHQQSQLQHYTHHSPYLQMQQHFGGAQNSIAYNPYIISQHHYQQSQSQMLMSSVRPTSASENEMLPSYQEPTQSSAKVHSTPSKLPLTAVENNTSNESGRDTGTPSYAKDEDRLEGASVVAATITSSPTGAQQLSTDCLTTSPPLISSTGTDSGISSCSTRASSDSTQSTPVYNNEYPMSVGSSSGISYHCADGKDFEEASNKEKEDTTAPLPVKNDEDVDVSRKRESNDSESNSVLIKQETKENEDVTQSKQYLDEQTENESRINDAKNEEIIAEKVKHEFNFNIRKTSIVPTPVSTTITDANHKVIQQHRTECNAAMSARISTSGSRTNTSPELNESSSLQNASQKTKYHQQAQEPQHQQQHQQQPLDLHFHQQLLQQQSLQLRQQRVHQQQLNTPQKYTPNNRYSPSSPPAVPAPPHNSPIGYSPFVQTTISSPSNPAVTNKNRIIECDLIPSKKKSKRKSSNDAEVEVREEIRDITPLPGFQQAFGSTEIGRFSEAFSFSPASADSTTDDFEAFINHERQQQQQQQKQQQKQQQQQQQKQQQQQYQQQYELQHPQQLNQHQSATSYYSSTAYAEGNYRNMHAAWPSASSSSSSAYEAYDYSAVPRGVSQLNQTFSSRPYNSLDMMFHERYGRYGSYKMNEGNFSEIRCNGY